MIQLDSIPVFGRGLLLKIVLFTTFLPVYHKFSVKFYANQTKALYLAQKQEQKNHLAQNTLTKRNPHSVERRVRPLKNLKSRAFM